MKNQRIIFFFLSTGLLLFSCCKEKSPTEPSGLVESYTVIGGQINGSLTADNSPYKVTSTLVIDASVTLNIENGVRIYFEDSTKLLIRGNIICSGTASAPILFSSYNNRWRGIEIIQSTQQSTYQFVIIENIDITTPIDSSRNGAAEITNANVVIQNSIFRNNRSNNGGALSIDRSQSLVTNNIFLDNYAVGYGGAMLSSSSSNQIINNTFYHNEGNNYGGGLILLSPILDEVQNNIFYLNVCKTGDPRISYLLADSSNYIAQYNFLQAGNNPFFISEKDFHLYYNSPCINAGNPAAQYNDVNGTRNDQGAYGGPLGNW